MKNRRAIFWLALALVLAVGAHVLLSYKGGATATLVQRTTLVEAALSSPTRMTVARPDERPAVIERTADGWRLVSPYASGVDERIVLRLLDLLATANIDGDISDAALVGLGRDRADLGLAAGEALRVSLSTDGAEETVLLGAATPLGDGVYAAVEGDDAVYVVSSNVLAAADIPPDGFRLRTIFTARLDDVVSFDVKHGSGSFRRFVREGEAWTLREPTVTVANAARIRELLGGLAVAEVADFIWPVGAKGEGAVATASLLAGYGLDPDSAVTLSFKCTDGVDRQVSFGKDASDGLVYALVQNAGAIVTVDGSLREQALDGTEGFTDVRLFTAEGAAVSRVSVADGAVNYLLAREDDGSWRMDAPVAAPADAGRVEALLERLLSLTSADLAEEGVAVSVSTSAPPVTVSRRAALGGDRLEDLRSREIVRIDPQQVKRIVVSVRGESPTALVYDRDRRAWNVEQSALRGAADVAALESLFAVINPLEAERIVALKVSSADLRRYGLESPRLTVAIDQERTDAVRRNLLVGDPVDGGGAYATLGAADAVFILSDAVVGRLSARLVEAR